MEPTSPGMADGGRLVGFDTSPGAGPPPPVLGGYITNQFEPDPRPVFVDVTSTTPPCPVPSSIAFSVPLNHRQIGSGWLGWSHGYTGDVYYTNGFTSVTITLPAPNCAFYFYVEPNPFSVHTFTVTAEDGSSTSFEADGSGGAAYCGVYGAGLSSITVSSDVDFAIGEFGFACMCCGCVACCFEATTPAVCYDYYNVLACIQEGGRWSAFAEFCADLTPPCGEALGACCYGPDADPGYEPYQCIGDMRQWECLAASEYTNWTGGASCSDPTFLCPGTPTYCDGSGGCDEYIARVQLNEIDNQTGCDGYADYTAMSATLIFGQTYPITVTNGTPYSSDVCSIWIDWNQDRTFEDTAPELIGDVIGGGAPPPYSMNIQVPATGGVPGYTRMRIRIDYANPDPDPCGTTTYGEVEDYSVLVVYGGTGACCYPTQYANPSDPWAGGLCLDGVEGVVCVSAGGEFHSPEDCGELPVVCGNPGACCNDEASHCEIALEELCQHRFRAGVSCEELNPPCGCTWCPEGVLYAPTQPDNAPFRAALSALLNVPVDYFDARALTPTLEQMSPYGAVFTWVNYAYADSWAMGDNLADYVDAGGRVILGQWCFPGIAPQHLSGRIMTDPAYCPISAVSTSYASGCYNHDGVGCPTEDIAELCTDYLEVVTGLQPGASWDGTIGDSYVAVWNSNYSVWYSPGNTAGEYGTGDWVRLTSNEIVCQAPPSVACCNISTGDCIDDMPILDCLAQGPMWHWRAGRCAALDPPCGNPGACCDIHTGVCIDTFEGSCQFDHFYGGQMCAALDPPCGGPLGCCCDDVTGIITCEPQWNCYGRFIPSDCSITVRGDLDLNGVVDMNDYNLFLDTFGLCAGDPGYNPWADLDGDDCISLIDFQTWRQCYENPGPTGCTADMFYPPCGEWAPVGLLYAPADGDSSAFRAAVSTILGQSVDYFDARYATPTVDQMRQYAAVLVWVNYPLDDKVLMGDRLADYVDRGGKAILGQWCLPTAGNYLSGRIMTPAYCPATAASWTAGTYNHDCFDCVMLLHPVGELYSGYCDVITALSPGAIGCGTFTTGGYALAWRPDRRVYCSPGNMGAVYGASGDWAALTANMVLCADQPLRGACCDEPAGVCTDDVAVADCAVIAGHRFILGGLCADLDPACGQIYGACCYETECQYQRPSECGGTYQGDDVACDPNPCRCADYLIEAPGQWTGSTCGAGDDCALRNGEEVIFAVTIPVDGVWTFSLCGSSYDTYWFFGTECCTSFVAQDDSPECGLAGYVEQELTAGILYIDLEGYSGCGDYTLTITGPALREDAPPADKVEELSPAPVE